MCNEYDGIVGVHNGCMVEFVSIVHHCVLSSIVEVKRNSSIYALITRNVGASFWKRNTVYKMYYNIVTHSVIEHVIAYSSLKISLKEILFLEKLFRK